MAWQQWLESRGTETPNLLARNIIIESVLPIIEKYAAARQMTLPPGAGIDVDDLTAAAVLAMPNVLEQFDPARRVKLTTYMSQRIKGAMSDWLREIDWVPRKVRAQQKDGTAPVVKMGSIEQVIQEGECRNQTIGDDLADDHDQFRDVDDRENFKCMLTGLLPATRLILTLYHVKEMTMKQIGKVVGLSESRVSQMVSQAYAILRAKPEIQEAGELVCTGEAGRENNRS